MANINWSKKIAYEGNVSIPMGEKWDKAYDLALFEELGSETTLVLLVTVIINFSFEDGDGGSWDDSNKEAFKQGVKDLCEKAWSEKFLIQKSLVPIPGLALDSTRTIPHRSGTSALNPSASQAKVAILIKTEESRFLWSKHWSITVHKLKAPLRPYVRDNSDVRWESTVLEPFIPYGGSKKRKSVVHEFGHLLGYRDEYLHSDRGTEAYTSETDSIMNLGETVMDRHYVFFADWITNKLNDPWAVRGRKNIYNTSL
jgi:hypothetical protein